jgi:cytochrome P450
MAAARDSDGRPYDDDVICGNAMQILLAGEDTTAHTLSWAVHLLLEHPQAAEALAREADGQADGELDGVQKLHFAGAVANETMRLKPVAPMQFYQPNADAAVGDVAVPKDGWVILLTRVGAMDAARFAEPEAFRPERWLEAPGAAAHDARAHIPFGTGPRICPGRSLARVEMRLVLATLYRNFSVERVGKAEEVREVFAFTMQPSAVPVRLRARG